MSNFKIKDVIAEDFINYKLPSMFIITSKCDWKCCHEGNFPESYCQNNPLIKNPTIEVSNKSLLNLFRNNSITQAVVIGGLEPFMQFKELIDFIDDFRKEFNSPIIIYTGYTEDELKVKVQTLVYNFKNIIIKYGRYIPNQKPHYDAILGIDLASDNQYAVKY